MKLLAIAMLKMYVLRSSALGRGIFRMENLVPVDPPFPKAKQPFKFGT